MKLAAVLACRNNSSRLYAKPLQNLDIKNNISIIDFIIHQMKLHVQIGKIILAISEGRDNFIYKEIAQKHKISYIFGDEKDVLWRLIRAGEFVKAENILRVTPECPFIYYDNLKQVFDYHFSHQMDYSITSGLPEGSYYEIISLRALKKSWRMGNKRHRSEFCTLYIFENQDQFKIVRHECERSIRRPELRLTVDWPEDLIAMRAIYQGIKLSPVKPLVLGRLIRFLDKNPKIKAINNWIDSKKGRVWY